MTDLPIEFMKYLEMTLFTDTNTCDFFEEVVIDNIPVHMTLKYLKIGITEYVRLILHNKNLTKQLNEITNDEDDEYYYNLLTDANFLKLCPHIPIKDKCKYTMNGLNELIDNIRFCKYTGKFIHKNNIHYAKVHQELPIFFKNNNNIKFNTTESNTCSVCYEPTITTTSCNHSICIPCAINIKHDVDNDVLCPICREVMTFV